MMMMMTSSSTLMTSSSSSFDNVFKKKASSSFRLNTLKTTAKTMRNNKVQQKNITIKAEAISEDSSSTNLRTYSPIWSKTLLLVLLIIIMVSLKEENTSFPLSIKILL